MGKWEIRPLATAKPLKRLSPKVADVITQLQNLATIPQGVSFPRMCKIVHQKCLLSFFFTGFFQWPSAHAREPIFTQNTLHNVVPCKDVPFLG